MVLYGYGKILDIDLSTGNIVKRDIVLQFAREFIGGMGFGCKILYDEVRLHDVASELAAAGKLPRKR